MKKAKTPKKQQKPKPYWEMTADELAEATKEYDRPIPLSKTRPLTPKQRLLWERMKRAPHRSIFISRDADGVWVRLDQDLLARTTKYAARKKMTLSEVISRSLNAMLVTAK